MAKKKVLILGGGVGGLSAGYYLQKTGNYDVTVLEKKERVGGICGSFEHNGFTLDYGAHKLYSVLPGIQNEIEEILGDRAVRVPKKHHLLLRKKLVHYPLKLGNLASVLGLKLFFSVGFGYGIAMLKGIFTGDKSRSYEDYMLLRFGRGAYELIFKPLAKKVWGPPNMLHCDLARIRVPSENGFKVILRLLGLQKELHTTDAESFLYPAKGFGDWPEALKDRIKEMGGRVIVNAMADCLEKDGTSVKAAECTVDGRKMKLEFDCLISSIPLVDLAKLVQGVVGNDAVDAVGRLKFRDVVLVYIFVKKPLILNDQWIFCPEEEYLFSRIFEQKQMNPDLGPQDRTVLCCDYTCETGGELSRLTDREIVSKCIDGLVSAGFIDRNDVESTLVKKEKSFYPCYDLEYLDKMQSVKNKFQSVDNLMVTGRIGLYNYNNADHCLDMGRFIAENLKGTENCKEVWDKLAEYVAAYQIVD